MATLSHLANQEVVREAVIDQSRVEFVSDLEQVERTGVPADEAGSKA